VIGSVVQYLRYLDKYRGYQRFDASIEEVSIYNNGTIKGCVIAFYGSPFQSYGASPAVWDPTVLPATDTGEHPPP